MKKVLITGATGFVGRQSLQLLLKKGYEIHAVSSSEPDETKWDVIWHKCDLLESEHASNLVKQIRPTHLLHFAWYVEPVDCWDSMENFRWVQASLHLLRTFAEQGGKRVVMSGTCAEYDWRYSFCSESITPLSPNCLYGICKHALQLILTGFSIQAGLSSAWGRIFFLYGPHEKPSRLVSSITRSLLLDQEAPCSHGNQLRDYMYVKDLADAFVALLESDAQGPINIASGNPVSIKEIAYKIAEKLDRVDLLRFGALLTPGDEPGLIVADTKRLSDEIRWQTKYDLDQGLEETIEWWRKRLQSGKVQQQ